MIENPAQGDAGLGVAVKYYVSHLWAQVRKGLLSFALS